jgi:hypothetical protein
MVTKMTDLIIPLQAYMFKDSDFNRIGRCPLAYAIVIARKKFDIYVSANNATIDGEDYRIKGGYTFRMYKSDMVTAKDCGYDNSVVREITLMPYPILKQTAL